LVLGDAGKGHCNVGPTCREGFPAEQLDFRSAHVTAVGALEAWSAGCGAVQQVQSMACVVSGDHRR
jgi:hypothetical protein